jgi:2-hydroxy-4-carboxymuconate semialdehyde hemiacetal dehydrogenase
MSRALRPINVCIVGYGMMGRWHSEALKGRKDCRLYSLVGRRAEPTAAFAKEFGFRACYTNLGECLSDPAIDAVIVASPSEEHAGNSMAALASGKHVLVEIPIAMSEAHAERMIGNAESRNLKLAAVYPMRMMPDMIALRGRLEGGEERLRMIDSRFIIKRWENVGWTGYRRSWTDNLLWHHLGHLVDFALWLAGSAVVSVSGYQPAPDPRTGTPMDASIIVATEADHSMAFIGSYAGHRPICGTLILTDRDCYQIDAITNTLKTETGITQMADEQADCAAALHDFLDAVRDNRPPAISCRSTLPAMRVLQRIQDSWEARPGIRSIPGRRKFEA